nr:M23 family metallopeptidase [Saccharomonospora amisosensis]
MTPPRSPARPPPSEAARMRSRWPLWPPPPVTRGFDELPHPYAAGHRGVDLAATAGQQVLAAADGTVVFAGTVAGRGVVSIDHEGGLRTTYQPLLPTVAEGDQVTAGQPLGTVVAGHPGCPQQVAACLHWGLRRGEEYLDPLRLVLAGPTLRLKPWHR